MANGESLSYERVLLVEGQNDMHVVRHLWIRHFQTDPGFYISVKQDVDSLLRSIRGEILGEGRTAVGILVDADDNPMNRWQAVANRLRAAGIIPPSNLTPSSTIIEGTPRVGVWLSPIINTLASLRILSKG